MIRPSLVLVSIMIAGVSLSGCSKQSGSEAAQGSFATGGPAASASGAPEDKFGEKFGKAFRAKPNDQPLPVAEGDLPPVSRTAEPVRVD